MSTPNVIYQSVSHVRPVTRAIVQTQRLVFTSDLAHMSQALAHKAEWRTVGVRWLEHRSHWNKPREVPMSARQVARRRPDRDPDRARLLRPPGPRPAASRRASRSTITEITAGHRPARQHRALAPRAARRHGPGRGRAGEPHPARAARSCSTRPSRAASRPTPTASSPPSSPPASPAEEPGTSPGVAAGRRLARNQREKVAPGRCRRHAGRQHHDGRRGPRGPRLRDHDRPARRPPLPLDLPVRRPRPRGPGDLPAAPRDAQRLLPRARLGRRPCAGSTSSSRTTCASPT